MIKVCGIHCCKLSINFYLIANAHGYEVFLVNKGLTCLTFAHCCKSWNFGYIKGFFFPHDHEPKYVG
jgi:hypothetical protein